MMATHSQVATLCLTLAMLLLATTALSPAATPPQPADHLVPPPAPTAAPVSVAAAAPSAQRLTHASSYAELPAAAAEAGFMTRVARWFGLGGATAQAPPSQSLTPRDQLHSAASHSSYAYPKPAQHFDAAGKPCGLCNKYPWVPMFGQQQQQQQHAQQHAQQQTLRQPPQQLLLGWQQAQQPQPLAQASQQRQRAVQFPPASQQSVFLPISVPVPALSHVALPPLYNAQPFRPLIQPQSQSQSHTQSQALSHAPAFAPSPSLENVGAHSELRPVPLPTSRPASSSNFEIVKSHRLTDFVTSVEYPATFVQSHAIDLGQTSSPSSSSSSSSVSGSSYLAASTQLPANHKGPLQEQQQESEQPLPLQDISTVRYQLEDLSSGAVHQHLPASQLLTELGHFETTQTTLPPPADNYPAASSQQQQQQEQDQEQQNLYYVEQYLEQQLLETSTVTPQYTEQLLYTTTEQPMPAAVELNNHLAPLRDGRQRETPKRMLDSPIQHAQGVAPPPRPFTRDPAELSVRHSQPPATKAPTPTSTYSAIDASGQFAGMSPPSPQQVIIPYTTKQKPRPFEPALWTPGWGGGAVAVRPQENDVDELHEQQESKLVTSATAAPPAAASAPPQRTTKYLTKILASNLRELLKRERETKRVRPSSSSSPIGVDISKLQHNIDGWTEQEYNSLSHRPSTPTIRGRSKHIPSEYLTTTTPATPTATSSTKITRGGFELGGGTTGVATGGATAAAGDLSTSINNLEQLHHLQRHFQPVDDNRLLPDYYETQHRQRYSTTPLASVTMPSTSSSTTTTRVPPTATPTRNIVTPLYVRTTPAPMELWKQAKVAILPQTNEKVYVVTPQPRLLQRHSHEPAAAASVQAPVYQTPSPRFPRVRPTPGTATAGELSAATPTPSTEQVRNYTPDIFGLMGLSAYVPAEPVEIIDGNSKVITIVTSAPTAAALQRPSAKSTIAPSPR